MNETYTKEAVASAPLKLIGKPVTVAVKGKKRQIGEVVGAHIEHNKFLHVKLSITDPAVKKMLGIIDVAEIE